MTTTKLPEFLRLKCWGVGRMTDNDKAVLLSFDRPLTDDELRALHDNAANACRATAPAEVAGGASDAVDFDIIDRLLDEHGCDCKPTSQDSIDCFDQRDKLRAFRATRPAPGRDGFVMVPVEALPEMLCAAGTMEGFDVDAGYNADQCHSDWYAAMIAAAPAPPAEPFGADFIRSIEP